MARVQWFAHDHRSTRFLELLWLDLTTIKTIKRQRKEFPYIRHQHRLHFELIRRNKQLRKMLRHFYGLRMIWSQRACENVDSLGNICPALVVIIESTAIDQSHAKKR